MMRRGWGMASLITRRRSRTNAPSLITRRSYFVQLQQPLQNRLVAQIFRPAVGAQNGRVEGAVDVVKLLYLGRADGLARFLVEGGAVERFRPQRFSETSEVWRGVIAS